MTDDQIARAVQQMLARRARDGCLSLIVGMIVGLVLMVALIRAGVIP